MISSPKILYHIKSQYSDISVVEENNIRLLQFNFGSGMCRDQSGTHVNYPYFHVFDYSLLAMCAFAFVSNPSNILMVGMGGAIIINHVYRFLPSVNVDIIEIDPEIPKIASEYFNFKPNSNTNIIMGDAFGVVNKIKNEKSYDIIFVDVFDSDYMPKGVQKKEFISAIKQMLKNEGVATWNITSEHDTYKQHIKNMISVFGDNMYYLKGPRNPVSQTCYLVKGDLKPNKSIFFASPYNLMPRKMFYV